MKMLQKMMALILVISMFMGVMVISASAVETSNDTTSENDFVDPPIGIKTSVEKGDYQYDVTISVPGDGEAVKVHDEIILIIDASYSCDEEWGDMKNNIIQIGEKVLGGAGRTQMTVMHMIIQIIMWSSNICQMLLWEPSSTNRQRWGMRRKSESIFNV